MSIFKKVKRDDGRREIYFLGIRILKYARKIINYPANYEEIDALMQDYKSIPIYIISYNRLECLQKLISFLESKGYYNLKIIDNASSYPPLLEYLKKLPYEVIFEKENLGPDVFWKDERFAKVASSQFYVLTDPDVVPIEDCPDDFMRLFLLLLREHRSKLKVGFSLKIDDIPDANPLKKVIVEWESKWWKHKIASHPDLYAADIDTTFALYRPSPQFAYTGIRTGYPYTARHLPWYHGEELSDEDVFYKNSLNKESNRSGTWNGQYSADEIRDFYNMEKGENKG